MRLVDKQTWRSASAATPSTGNALRFHPLVHEPHALKLREMFLLGAEPILKGASVQGRHVSGPSPMLLGDVLDPVVLAEFVVHPIGNLDGLQVSVLAAGSFAKRLNGSDQ